jgi:hypothetical protein
MGSCIERGLPFKLTAGLHHAVRAMHPLSYEHGSPCATMHGFLNVLVACALAVAGAPPQTMEGVLGETDGCAFVFDDDDVTWRGRRATLADIDRSRQIFRSIGSCSFDEPLSALELLGLL